MIVQLEYLVEKNEKLRTDSDKFLFQTITFVCRLNRLGRQKEKHNGVDIFIDIIEKAYQGTSFQYGKETFRLTPAW
ncbi:MAG: hypothetical protein LBQ98_00380 [Nitrososphaerota archaeon]|nr:hypothetical protein [Nitrososphaerota archaeon]